MYPNKDLTEASHEVALKIDRTDSLVHIRDYEIVLIFLAAAIKRHFGSLTQQLSS